MALMAESSRIPDQEFRQRFARVQEELPSLHHAIVGL